MATYMDIDIPVGKETEINNAFVDGIKKFYNNGFANQKLKIGDTECETIGDYVDFAENMVIDAFGNENPNLEIECKALTALYMSGLKDSGTNLLGVYSLILSAIYKVGSSHDIDVVGLCKKYASMLEDTNVSADVVGSISKCNLLGKGLDTATDDFAKAEDERYNHRIMAINRDDVRANRKEYNIRYNQYLKYFRAAKAEGKTTDEAVAEANEKLKGWHDDGSYQKMLDRHANHSSRMTAAHETDDEDVAFF